MASEVMTPEAILSFPDLVTPTAGPGKDPKDPENLKYRATLVFAPGTDISVLMKAVLDAAVEEWGPKAQELLKTGQLKNPFITKDAERYGYPKGSIYIRPWSKFQPQVVSRYGDENGQPLEIPTARVEAELYAGAKVRAYVRPFPYDTAGNRGISFNLGNMQKLGDGERLDNRVSATEQFEALEDLGKAEHPFGGQDAQEAASSIEKGLNDIFGGV